MKWARGLGRQALEAAEHGLSPVRRRGADIIVTEVRKMFG